MSEDDMTTDEYIAQEILDNNLEEDDSWLEDTGDDLDSWVEDEDEEGE
jgi:hypothetical protein